MLALITQPKDVQHDSYIRLAEQDKIKCGKAHFAALGSGVDYRLANSVDVLEQWVGQSTRG